MHAGPRRVRRLHQETRLAAAAMRRLGQAGEDGGVQVVDGSAAAQVGSPAAGRVCHVCQRAAAQVGSVARCAAVLELDYLLRTISGD